MKKFLSVILAICLVVAMVPITASAETATSGTTGDCTWTLDGTVLTISGNGEMEGYYYGKNTPWGTNITQIIIEDGVTSIGYRVFENCTGLTSITIPNSVTRIGNDAFTNTGYYNNAENWQDDVLYIGNYLIKCKETKTGEYKIKDGTKAIADEAFWRCENLAGVTIPNSVTTIGDASFAQCNSLTSIVIPDSVTDICRQAFLGCKNLVSITIPDSVENVTRDSFFSIGYFNNEDNWQDDVLYIGNHLISCKETKTGEYKIKDGTKTIAEQAFVECKKLTSVTIPDSVTRIGKHAFLECHKLTSVTIPDSVTSIGNGAFDYCIRLTSIRLPNNLTVLDDWVFNGCNTLSKIYIPKNLTLIKRGNFGNNSWGQNTDLTVYYEGNEDDWAQITVLDYNERLTNATVKYNKTDLPFTNYGDWKVDVETSGIYAIAPSTEIDGFETENIIVFDKSNKEVKYNADKLGWPLIKGESYAVKLKSVEDTTVYDDVDWNLTLRADTIFPDTTADGWYNDAVTYAVGAGIMTGYKSNGLFGTSDSIQRQDFIVMLARYDGVDLSDYENLEESTFPDVAWNSYYEAAVEWGADKGVITGYTVGDKAGRFGVGDTITREQLVTMLYRYAKNVLGKDETVSGDAAANAAEKFNDYSKVSVFSKEAVLWATEKGVITGKGVNKDSIDPQGNAQRCEVAQIMYNIFKNNIL